MKEKIITSFRQSFFDISMIHWRKNKLDFMKFKNVCSTELTIERMKSQATDWKYLQITLLKKKTSIQDTLKSKQ